MSIDTETDDLDLLDRELGTDDGDDEPKGRSIRDSLEKAWEDHGGELTEDRKEARERRREERDERQERRRGGKDKDKPKGDGTGKASPFYSREAPKGDQGKQVSPQTDGQAAPDPASSEGPSAWWKKDGKELWDRLDPQARQLISQRENLMTQGARQLQERYGGIHRITQHLAPRFQRYNLAPERGFANMASWFEAIENNPAAGLRELAKLYKVDLTNGVATPQPAPNGAPTGQTPQARPQADPRIDSLMRWAGEMQQTRRNEVQEAKLSAWSPNRPHFAAVRSLMGDLLENAVRSQDPRFMNDAGTDVDLDKLYEAAVRVHPEVGLQVIEEQAEAKRREQQARITQARRAGSSVRPGTPGSAPLKGEQQKKLSKGSSVRQHVQQAWDDLRSA
jgi:hypothetical protein